MKTLFTKSLISSGFIVATLALAGSGAIAADTPTRHSPAAVHVTHRPVARVATRFRKPPIAGNNDLGQFIAGFFGGAMPQQYANRRGSDSMSLRRRMTTRRRSTQVRPVPMRRRRPIKRSSKYSR